MRRGITDQQIVDRIKELSSGGCILTQAEWSCERGEGYPSHQTVIKRLGKWSDIAEKLGLSANRPFGEDSPQPVPFDYDSIVAKVKTLSDGRYMPTQKHYDRNRGELPSARKFAEVTNMSWRELSVKLQLKITNSMRGSHTASQQEQARKEQGNEADWLEKLKREAREAATRPIKVYKPSPNPPMVNAAFTQQKYVPPCLTYTR